MTSEANDDSKDFRYYLHNNAFEAGGDELFSRVESEQKKLTPKSARFLIDAMRLWLFVRGPEYIKEKLIPWQVRIREVGFLEDCEVDLLFIRCAYQKGFHYRSYNLASHLDQKIEQALIDKSINRKVLLQSCLLPRVHIMAAKALYRRLEHSLARVHLSRAYDCLIACTDATQNEYKYLFGKIYTIFARSYFDYPDRHDEIIALLNRGIERYDTYFGNTSQSERTQLFYGEVQELKALYLIEQYKEGWFPEALINISKAIDLTINALGRNTHRRVAHLYRYKALTYLNRARQLKSLEKDFTTEVIELLNEALKLYNEEINIRLEYFKDKPHPTLARAYNYQASVFLLLAESKLSGLSINIEDSKRYIFNAQLSIKNAIDFNEKSKVAKLGDILTTRLGGARFTEEMLFLEEFIDPLQRFTSSARQLKLWKIRYKIKEWRGESFTSRHEDYLAAKETYNTCRGYLKACDFNLVWEGSKETTIARFLPVQESFLEIAQSHLEACDKYVAGDEKRDAIINDIFRVHVHGKKNENWDDRLPDYPTYTKDVKLRDRLVIMASLQSYSLHRFLIRDKEKKQVKSQKQNYGHFPSDVKIIIDSHFALLKQKHHQRKPALENQKKITLAKANDIINVFDDPVCPAGLLSYFIGSKHVFVLIVLEGDKFGKAPLKTSIRLNAKNNSFAFVNQLKKKARDLRDAISRIHNTYHDLNQELKKLKQNSEKWKSLKDTIKHLIQSPELNFTETTSQSPGYLNAQWLCLAYELYQLLFSEILTEETAHLERLYLCFNHDALQRIPFGLLPIVDPKTTFKNPKKARYEELIYFGTNWQHAVIPSLAELWRLRRPDPRSPDDTCSAYFGKPLPKKDSLKIFTGVRGIDRRRKRSSGLQLQQLAAAGTNHFNELWKYVLKPKDGISISQLSFFPILKGTGKHLKGAKESILRAAQQSLILYFFCHLRIDKNNKFDQKKIELNEPDPALGASPKKGPILKSNPDFFHHEEIACNNFRNNWLVFINGCGASEGPGRRGYLPFSMMTSFLKAGSRAVLGTQYETYTQPAHFFAERFFTYWIIGEKMHAPESGKKPVGHIPPCTLGEAIRKSSNHLLHGVDKDYKEYANPIHWGAYTLLGDTTMTYQQLIDFNNAHPSDAFL
ncbi:CHAT domain-containing protein [Neolewinella agarilytica]|uniref:CHAT domain-containing protein n=1 Tax=Neolewinella agarilytica TaxID=478744 RepID=A0A1H9NIP8_9BACT|nr:CHAT domain-containing protein [Neolewinella agarilytica]SER35263.1 CHAT domain-containing protein [Neolewinella agarilytica]